MRFRFLGTGVSIGVPMIGCRCAVCTSTDPRNRRLRTSALLEANGHTLLIDVGPEFRLQALAAGIDHLDGVLLTHAHFDHIGGLDDLRPLTFQRSLPIYSDARTLAEVRERFAYAFNPAPSESTRPALSLVPIQGPFQSGPLTIQPLPVRHGSNDITAFRIGQLGYVTDASFISDETITALRGVDVLVLGALRYRPHPMHFSLEEACAMVARIRPERAFFVHMNHDLDHATVEASLPADVFLAYDGLELDIPTS